MWPSSSLSKSRGRSRSPASDAGVGSSPRRRWHSWSMSSAVTGAAGCCLASSSVVAMLTPERGVNSGTTTPWMCSRTAARSSASPAGVPTPYTAARRRATAHTKDRCRGSSASNTMGDGGFLAPLQKGCPVEVSLSRGKLWRSCLMLLAYSSSNRRRAHATQCSKLVGREPPRASRTRWSTSSFMFCWLASEARNSSGVPWR
mmetsp:Transcript_6141/g.20694  ORF Transcript_6141/g.20694 Transcript_6141/m.20694 type:complete len:202 (+) Transcript_6141:691-1296(+)